MITIIGLIILMVVVQIILTWLCLRKLIILGTSDEQASFILLGMSVIPVFGMVVVMVLSIGILVKIINKKCNNREFIDKFYRIKR